MDKIENNKEQILNAAKVAFAAIEDKFGHDTIILDISKNSSLADYFIISAGNSHSQLRAMSDAAEEALLKEGLAIKHAEGLSSGNWILLNFGSIIVHLFTKEEREFYNLEKVWEKGVRVEM